VLREKVIIVGSGPAGLTAGLYTARDDLNPLIISGNEIGGQVSMTNEVENYPAFPEGMTGPQLVDLMRRQAGKFGARSEIDEVIEVDFTRGSPFYLKTYGQEYQADAVIITTGASPKRLAVPGEEAFIGRGVSFCATCDGFFYRDKDVVVVGGGDSALEEGLITDHLMMTSVPGVFAAGEVQDPVFRQVVSSAGQGSQAAISAERWLAAQGIE
jgi:thioredoxin reductase (NADPH)